MKTTDFFFNLPNELIAQFPSDKRGGSRLLVLDRKTKTTINAEVRDLKKFIPKKSLLVFNNSRVRKARLYAFSETGGKVELIFIRPVIDSLAENQNLGIFFLWEVISSKKKRQKVGKVLILPDESKAIVERISDNGQTLFLRTEKGLNEDWFSEFGHIPLPPYIKREDKQFDSERYQTVYSKEIGSVAAPTAGLHFTKNLFDSLEDDDFNIKTAEVTLHVGLGTFLPVRTESIFDHKMHSECYFISSKAAAQINAALDKGWNIIAVGTTSVRTLESAGKLGRVKAGYGDTNIFIYPGYSFNIVNHLFTNFHTPESTLLMLVSAFAGKNLIFETYQKAIEQKYQFFSYGDAMLIL